MMTVLLLNISQNTLQKQSKSSLRKEESDLSVSAALLLDSILMEDLISTILTHLDLSQNGRLRAVEETQSKFVNSWRSTTKKDKVTKRDSN